MRVAQVGVWCRAESPEQRERAEHLANRLTVPVVLSRDGPGGDVDLVVVFEDDHVALHEPGDPGRDLVIDLTRRDLRPGTPALSKRQPLARAIGPAEFVVDATAGLGQDAILLAHLGYQVLAIERSPVLAALLRDAVDRAAASDPFREALDRLRLVEGDSIKILAQTPCDVVYIDPMYPPKRKQSALAPRPIRLVRRVVGEDADCRALIEAACRVARRRVVVKRPHHAEPLIESPDFTIESKLVRYDVWRGGN